RHSCPNVQAPTACEVQCPACVRDGNAGVARTSGLGKVARALRPGGSKAIVTYTLIGLNVLIYGLQWLTSQALTEAWFLNPYVSGSEPWRLITSAFLHSPSTI